MKNNANAYIALVYGLLLCALGTSGCGEDKTTVVTPAKTEITVTTTTTSPAPAPAPSPGK